MIYDENNVNNYSEPPYQPTSNEPDEGAGANSYEAPVYPKQNPYAQSATPYSWNFEEYENAAPRKKKKNRFLKGLTICASVVLAAGLLSFSGYGMYTYFTTEDNSTTVPNGESSSSVVQDSKLNILGKPGSGNVSSTTSNGEMSTQTIAKQVTPSVVGISKYDGYNTFTPSSTGSGIVMSLDGYIITNAHVVENAVGINVDLYNGESYSAQLIGIDTKTDLAVIKIQADGLIPATFGNSEELEVGERIIAIGNPGGSELKGSVTQGIVSGINRMIKEGGYSVNYIQVDAAINPGNSGGALVNEFGQVVGINSAKIAAVEFEGIGFAIPINEAKPIVDDLIQNGYVTGRTKIGISGNEINEGLSQINGIPTGVLIITIEPTSDLAGKNVAKGDIITHIDGTRVETFDDISSILKQKAPGDIIVLSIYRRSTDGSDKRFDTSVALMPDIQK